MTFSETHALARSQPVALRSVLVPSEVRAPNSAADGQISYSQAIPHFSKWKREPLPGSVISASQDQSPSMPSSSHESTWGGKDVPNRDNVAGNLSAKSGRPRAFHLTQREWRMLSSNAFREFVGDRPGAAKALAEEIECSPKTAQSWLDGESTPAGILDLRAMSRVPAYAALKREIAQMESTMDPRLQAKYQELHALTLALANGERP